MRLLERGLAAAALVSLAPVSGSAQQPGAPPYIASREATAWEGRPFDARIPYGPDPLQFGELRLPEGAELHDPDPLPVRGVVSLAGIADLVHYHDMHVEACGDTPTQLLGGTPPPESPRTAQASPAALLPTGVPQLLVPGEDDYAVPPAHGEAYAALAASKGQEATHHVHPPEQPLRDRGALDGALEGSVGAHPAVPRARGGIAPGWTTVAGRGMLTA